MDAITYSHKMQLQKTLEWVMPVGATIKPVSKQRSGRLKPIFHSVVHIYTHFYFPETENMMQEKKVNTEVKLHFHYEKNSD